MPNHTTNILTLADESRRFQEVIKPFLNAEGDLDFETLIRMPLDLVHTQSPTKIMTQAEIDEELAKNAANPSPYFSTGITHKQYCEFLQKYGAANWYDWAVKNWGTKWNSYDGHLTETGMTFYTAWSVPYPIFQKLAEVTGETFKVKYADEGGGFIGVAIFGPDGEVNDESYDQWNQAPESLQEDLGVLREEEDEDEDEE